MRRVRVIILAALMGAPLLGSAAQANPATLPNGASESFTITVAVSPTLTGSLTNTATVAPPSGVTDTNSTNNSASDTDTLTPQADLSITKDDGKTSVVPGTNNTYTITVTNNLLDVTVTPQSGVAPLTVQFASPGVDSSGNTVTNWNWNFGDGGTSTA